MVFWGSIESVMAVFNMADAAMGLMASVNLVAIVLLSPIVFKLTRDYFAQKQTGVPCFNPDDYPELRDKIEVSVWKKSS